VAALRQLAGPLTQLDNPGGFAYRSATDELYLAEHTPLPTMTGEILVFPRTTDGNVAPSRVIAGPSTQLGTFVSSVAAHPVLPEIYALVGTADGDGSAGSIVTFAASDAGDAIPLRVISGSQTLLRNNNGFEYDPRTDEFVVFTNVYGSGTPALLFFPRTATGDIAPSRVLSGSSTGLGESYGPLAASLDLIFDDGFEATGP